MSQFFSGSNVNLSKHDDGVQTVQVDAESALSGKFVMFYFSAHWCPPCRGFTPKLVETYKNLKSKGAKFEIVFVSADHDDNSYKEYFGEMPWLSIGFKNNFTKPLNDKYQVEGIPSLIIVDPKTGNPISQDGRSAVEDDPQGNNFPWKLKPLNSLKRASEFLNDEPCMIALLDQLDEKAVEDVIKAYEPIASELVAKFAVEKGNDEEVPVRFVYGTKEDPLTARVRQFLNLSPKVTMVLLNIPSGTKSIFEDEVNAASIRKFAEGFLSKALPTSPLKE